MKPALVTLGMTGWLVASGWAADPAATPRETAFIPDAARVAAQVADHQPVVLKIAVNDIYCRKTACECISKIATREFDGLLAKLKSEQQITLEFTYFMEVFDLDKAIQAKRFDGVLCKPWTALRFAPTTGANYSRVADLCDPDDKPLMTGLWITPIESPIRTLQDLQGKRLAIGQPDSYEKHQAPLQTLASAGIKPLAPLCYSSCGENLDALMSAKVDAAVISSYAFTASCAVDFAKPENFRVIAKTPEMPLTSLLVDLNKVSPATATRLQAALIAVSGDQVPKDLGGKGFVLPASWKPVQPAAALPSPPRPAAKP